MNKTVLMYMKEKNIIYKLCTRILLHCSNINTIVLHGLITTDDGIL
jgi:hypothetical protein